MTHRVRVRFEGDEAGEEELTWGQRAVWRMMRLHNSSEPIGGTVALGEGTTVESVATVLSFLMSRHQSLRMTLRVDESGNPRQVVSAAGETTLEVVDAGDDDDPAEVAAEVRQRYEAAPFDHAAEWPLRWAVVRHRGTPRYVVAVYPHIAIDAYGFEALVADLANLDQATGRQLAPVAGVQPLDLAREQRSAIARRRNAAALHHWERQLRAIPARRFAESVAECSPRCWLASYTSPAAYLAMRAIAARAGLHTGPVLLAAYAVIVGRLTGIHPSVVRVQVSNRFRRGLAASVTSLAQYALCVMDTSERGFDEVVVRAWQTLLEAGKYAYCDPVDLWALIDRVNRERGEEISLGCFFNDRRGSLAQQPIGAPPAADEIRAALPLSQLRWGQRHDVVDGDCFLDINAVPDTLDYTMEVDTRFISPDDLQRLLRDFEGVLVKAALGEDAAPVGGERPRVPPS